MRRTTTSLPSPPPWFPPNASPNAFEKPLFTLEEAASPENHDRLHETTNRRLPCISLGGLCDLDHALELWFAAPDELAQFQDHAAPEPPSGHSSFSVLHSPFESPAPC